jgi:PAS domain S-box-containing protein
LAAAAVLVVAAASVHLHAQGGARWPVVPFVVLLTAAGWLQVNFAWRDEVYAWDLFEAILTPIVFAFPPALVLVMVALGKGISQAVLRVSPMKACFNVAQWMFAAGVGSVVFVQLRSGTRLTGGNLLALVLAMGVVMAINELCLVVVLRIVNPRSLREVLAGVRPVIVPGWIIGGMANLALGTMFVAAYNAGPWTLPLYAVPLALLHLADRGYVDIKVDQERLAGLQRATHALVQPVNPLDALGDFLELVRDSFGAERVELHLIDHERVKVYAAPPEASLRIDRDETRLASLLLADGVPARVDGTCGDARLGEQLQREGWRDCLAVPLRAEGTVVGMLCTYNRTGVEGFQKGELAVLEALAQELSGAFSRVRLFDQIMDEREKLAQIVGSTSDGIATIGVGGKIESWNPAMFGITGYDSDRMVGSPRLPILQARDEDEVEVPLDRWYQVDALPETIQIVTALGDTRWLSCAYSRVEATAERPACCIIVARDVTQTHELDRMKDEFVSMVSHELRTPLTPILGWATTLLEAGSRLSPDQQRDAYQAILRQGQRLRDLIFNLLEASKIETGNLTSKMAMFDAGQLAARVYQEAVESWSSREIRLKVSPDLRMASGDEWFAERILVNMLSNAIKYAPADLPIQVNVVSRADTIDISVADQGPGIPRYLHDQVFDRFARFSSDNTQAGSGLGLYIAKRLAEHMGSQISLDSDEGQGATFTLHLRTAPALASVKAG